MKRLWIFVPLLALAPAGSFFGSYFAGAGVFPESSGFLLGAASMLLLPWIIAALFLTIQKPKVIRVTLFVAALVVQIGLIFATPPGATSEMMGIAHRYRHEFSIIQLRECADQLRQRFQNGTLRTTPRDKNDFSEVSSSALVVSESELPNALRGRFQRVYLQTTPESGDLQVVFAKRRDRGIICDSRKSLRQFFIYSMADGVHAYRYQRL